MLRANSTTSNPPRRSPAPRAASRGRAQFDFGVDDLTTMLVEKLVVSDENADPTFDGPVVNGTANVEHVLADWEKERREYDKLFDKQAKEKIKKVPKIKMPSQFNTGFKPHKYQVEAIRWMVDRERNTELNPFYRTQQLKDGTIATYNRLTGHRLPETPKPFRGAILADDLGLGKTVMALGLMLSNPPEGVSFPIQEATENPVCTLVVTNVAVIPHWQQEIEKFVKPGTLRVGHFAGTSGARTRMVRQIQSNKFDVVIASYDILASEWTRKKEDEYTGDDDVFGCQFHRVVLDEAQNIRNRSSKRFQAVRAIKTKNRLCLTGTPFVNKPEDIHSLLAFLGLDPLCDPSVFKYKVVEPIKERKFSGLNHLRTAMAVAALRRTKAALKLDELPEKEVNICRVDFSNGQHKVVYDTIFQTGQAVFESLLGAGSFGGDDEADCTDAHKAMFEMQLRARQACNHPKLVPKERYERASMALHHYTQADGTMKRLTKTEANDMLAFLQMGSAADEDTTDDVVVSVYDEETEDSPKVSAMLAYMDQHMERDEKAVVFSQWCGYLDVVQSALVRAGHKVVRLDGKMPMEARALAMEKFNNDDEVRVIVCSLQAASVGINLSRANVVMMMDPWWNDAGDAQAIDRVHRIGQTRKVRCFRYVMKDSIEERMIDFQKSKACLGKGSMESLSRDERQWAKLTYLKDLFGIADKEAKDHMWK